MTETRSQRLGRLRKQAAYTSIFVIGSVFATPVFAHQTETSADRLDSIGGSVIDQVDGNSLSQTLSQLDPSVMPAGSPISSADQGRIQKVLSRAMTLLGIPYRWGGTSTNGFDCSGLVGYVFRTALGINLPRVSREIAHQGTKVQAVDLAEGDLVFFRRGGRGGIDHVGIYLGDGKFLHAPRTGRDVTVSKLDGYWSQHLVTARRIASAG
ncbi:C40 family peptidase [Solilutibacter silvestris]|uniref:Cell wall-associated hydrolase n=1 Tax=Solilutibacter silvestris TaxID=1645665 RepID=A0A2K1Q3N5_9GAMM|nr:Cell wall-associated hydrolase [Lysobacter silvestris]